MPGDLIGKLRRAAGKSPKYIARRLLLEASAAAERYLGPARCRRLAVPRLLQLAQAPDVHTWWQRLAALPGAAAPVDATQFDRLCPGARGEILRRAERAAAHQVELLGSGPVDLGPQIDWQRDAKTGVRWAPAFHRDIDYVNLGQPSDVKFPWELSRLQWALPLGQAWRLTGDDRYAQAARELLDSWIEANPYGHSVNWSCTMEPALRILTWIALFRLLHAAPAWGDEAFRGRFLRALLLHADFVARNLEEADVNGNHFTADAAGLVCAGLFFGELPLAVAWQERGWQILCSELPRQVFADGVDFEASVPYHRLVLELFAYPAIERLARRAPVDSAYRERLLAMGRFVAAYSRDDGSTPLVGDADDGRALAFGTQALGDHRYLLGVLGRAFDDQTLLDAFSGPRDELAWLLGTEAAASLPARDTAPAQASAAFREGGFFVLRHAGHHVFIDCGPLGLAGRGGHGHNDLLSFEAALDGVSLVSDCGAYLYTASATERNRFRSTALHNTPQIDGEEINRFVRPDYLWSLHNDARHEVLAFEHDAQRSAFEGRHDGYRRLASPTTVTRRFELEHASGRLTVQDRFEGDGKNEGVHRISTRWHLAPGVEVTLAPAAARAELQAAGRRFALAWGPGKEWQCRVEPGRVSPSYGCVVPVQVLVFERNGTALPLQVTLEPQR